MTSNYLITVIPDRNQAEEAFNALQSANLSAEQMALLGNGHMSADEFGLIEPNHAAKANIGRLVVWLVPFGFVAGFLFNWLTKIQIGPTSFATSHILGGLLGAGAGIVGAMIVGTLVGWTSGSGDALAYRNSLNAGKYVIIVQGSDQLVDQATGILNSFGPENIQGYSMAS